MLACLLFERIYRCLTDHLIKTSDYLEEECLVSFVFWFVEINLIISEGADLSLQTLYFNIFIL